MSTYTILASAQAENTGEVYKTNLSTGNYRFIADEPKQFGGGATGPAPMDYLCIALASCKAITIRMYANRKRWNLVDVQVKVDFVKGTQLASGMNTFFCYVKLIGDLSAEQAKRVLEISKSCPVDRLLIKPSEVITVSE